MISHSQRAEYFERLYVNGGYPFYGRSSYSEKDKYENTLSVLPSLSYRNALELGCAVGVMTEHLSTFCDSVTAIDCAESALSKARERCRGIDNITFKKAIVPDEFPVGRFDLITMSEMGYYLSLFDLTTTCALMAATLEPGGHILLVHRFGEICDGPLDAAIVHEHVRKYPELRSIVSVTRPDYLVDVLQVTR